MQNEDRYILTRVAITIAVLVVVAVTLIALANYIG